MSDKPNILKFENVTVDDSHGYDVGLRDVSLSVDRGQLVLILLERPFFNTPFADVASGLVFPDAGKVCFCDRDWARTLASRAARQRSCIGRIFDGRAWVSNLDMDENILLSQRHHSHRTEAEMCEEAEAVARRFGLPGLPTTRPATTSAADLRRSACVRAFLGKPSLLLLERPEHGLYPALMEPLIQSIELARAAGAAVVWLTNLVEVFDLAALKPTVRYRMQGPVLRAEQSESTGRQSAADKL
jgi:phospholipid/cholesterol/gamma-HCH transport system ATP-binding protein